MPRSPYGQVGPVAALAALAYIPLLLTQPGRVAADTKQYLYLDPGRLLSSAASIWDPSVAGGEVTHQNIGYLFPQGPFYWLFAEIGVPTWVAQRLWVGSLLFAAGAGVWYLCRVLGIGTGTRLGTGAADDGRGVVGMLAPLVAGVVYMLSPYPLQYVQRISALVMPWSGLGWMLAFTVLALRKGGWRYPALFGIVVAMVGGTNATSLLDVGLAPVLYLPYEVWISREATWRQALAAAARIAVLSVGVSLWWASALGVEAAYGINVLKFTETIPAIASTSLPSEVMRGLGYWYFYGEDQLGPWLTASVDYETRIWLVATSFSLPLLGVVGGVVSRWRLRAYFVGLILVGVALSVGTYPYANPSFLGRGLLAFMTGTTAGFAIRSTDRATPIVLLGLAVLIGAGVSALSGRFRAAGVVTALAVTGLAIANATPLLTGAAVAAKFTRPSQLPSYVNAAASYLDAQGDSTRVLLEPGENFAAYTFGTTTDSIWPGVMTRPTIERQQLIDGSLPTADLLEAFDSQLQQGTYEPSTLVPIARLLSAGDVVLQSDEAYWWYATPKPVETWQLFRSPPPGAGRVVSFGPPVSDSAPSPYQDVNDATLGLPVGAPRPPEIAVFPISDARPIYRAEPAADPLIVDGDGSGLVSAAATGLLAANPTIFYAGSLDGDARLAREALTPGAALLITDTNGKEDRRWTSVGANIGELESESPGPTTTDPSAVPLDLFPGAPPTAQTTAVYSGAVYVTASSYGNATTLTPEDRPYAAFDGDPTTAWTTGAFGPVDGNWIELRLDRPHTISSLKLVQPLGGDPDRFVTGVKITFDDDRSISAALTPSSRRPAGQTLTFPSETFTTLRITIVASGSTPAAVSGGSSGVGFAEIAVPGVTVRESVALPGDLLTALGASSLNHRLTIIVTRLRAPDPPRSDPESTMTRVFDLPTARTFSVAGTARISTLVADNVIDDLLAGPHVFGGAVIGSDARLPGDLEARAVFAFDGNPRTAWEPGFGGGHQVGAWMEMALPKSVGFDHLNLRLLDDGRHSDLTALRITTNDDSNVLVHIPPVAPPGSAGHTAFVRVRFPVVHGSVVRFTIAGVRPVGTPDYYSGGSITTPVAIAEIGVPGVRFSPENPSSALPDVCRTDVLSIDGRPVPVRVLGTVGQAEADQGLRVIGCGSAAGGLHLAAGRHTLQTAAAGGLVGGYDLDRVDLDSAPGGSAMPLQPDGDLVPVPGTIASPSGSPGRPAATTPVVRVESSSATAATLQVSGATVPFWLVLGQSSDAGWRASIAGGTALGAPVLIDGYANGWYVVPPPGRSPFVVSLTFAPQGEVTDAIALSGLALVACLLLAVWPRRVRLRRRSSTRKSRFLAMMARFRSSVVPAGGTAPGLGVDGRFAVPTFAPGSRQPASRPSLVTIAIIGTAGGAIGAALVPPPWYALSGLVVAASLWLGLSVRRSRLLVAIAATASALAMGISVVAGEAGQRVPIGGSWPGHFSTAAFLGWFAILTLAADVALGLARRPDSSIEPGPPSAREEPPVPAGTSDLIGEDR